MAQRRSVGLGLGTIYVGALARLRAQLYDITGTVYGALVSSGFATVGDDGNFLWTYDFPDGFAGAVLFLDSDTGDAIPNLPPWTINPGDIADIISVDADTTLAYIYTYDKDGDLQEGAEISFKLVEGPNIAGQSHYSKEFVKESDEDGRLEVVLLKNAKYQAWRGIDPNAIRTTFETTDADSFQIPEILGYE